MSSVMCESGTMVAICQGALCYETAYDAPVFDLTCVCPVGASLNISLRELEPEWAESAGCTEVNADDKRSCAVSSKLADVLELYDDASQLEEMIYTVQQASGAGDASKCPTIGSKFPKWSGEHSADDD